MMKNFLVLSVILFSFLLIGCGEQLTDEEKEVFGAEALAGQATASEKTTCKQDPVCRGKLIECYRNECRQLTSGRAQCINDCWDSAIEGEEAQSSGSNEDLEAAQREISRLNSRLEQCQSAEASLEQEIDSLQASLDACLPQPDEVEPAEEHTIRLLAPDDKHYELEWTNGYGRVVTLPVIHNLAVDATLTSNNDIGLGEDPADGLSLQGTIKKGDFFFLTGDGKSYLVEYRRAEPIDEAATVQFRIHGSSESELGFESLDRTINNDGTGVLKLDGTDFIFRNATEAMFDDDYELFFDRNADGTIEENEEVPLIDFGGAEITFDDQTPETLTLEFEEFSIELFGDNVDEVDAEIQGCTLMAAEEEEDSDRAICTFDDGSQVEETLTREFGQALHLYTYTYQG